MGMLDERCSTCISKVWMCGGGEQPSAGVPRLRIHAPLLRFLEGRSVCHAHAVCAMHCVYAPQISEDDIEIDVDRIDPASFWTVDKFVKECLGVDKKRSGGASAGPAGAPSAKKQRQ